MAQTQAAIPALPLPSCGTSQECPLLSVPNDLTRTYGASVRIKPESQQSGHWPSYYPGLGGGQGGGRPSALGRNTDLRSPGGGLAGLGSWRNRRSSSLLFHLPQVKSLEKQHFSVCAPICDG